MYLCACISKALLWQEADFVLLQVLSARPSLAPTPSCNCSALEYPSKAPVFTHNMLFLRIFDAPIFPDAWTRRKEMIALLLIKQHTNSYIMLISGKNKKIKSRNLRRFKQFLTKIDVHKYILALANFGWSESCKYETANAAHSTN